MLKSLLRLLSRQAKSEPNLPLFTSMDIVEIRIVLEDYIQRRIQHDKAIEDLLKDISGAIQHKVFDDKE